MTELTLDDCLKPIESRPKKTEEDEIIRLIAESEERTLNRAERSLVNRAEWAERAEKSRKGQRTTPDKTELARMPIGTAVGNKQRVAAFKEYLLSEVNGTKVIRKVLEIAMDDKHPGQMSALKLCIDRQLPVSMFEPKAGGGRTAISITISGIGETATVLENADVTDV